MRQVRQMLAAALLLVPLTVSAATLETGNDRFLFEQQSDRYEFGGNVSLSSPFPGDVLLLGETVTIDERVNDDVMALGKVVIVNTTVGGNLRVAGETVIIRGIVEGSVLAMGSSVTLQEGARVNGDITALGATVTLNGDVNGDVFVRAENGSLRDVHGNVDMRGTALSLGGTVNGDAVLAGRIAADAGAHVNGNLRYWSPDGATLSKEQVRGTVLFDTALAAEMHERAVTPATIGTLVLGAVGIFSVLSALVLIVAAAALLPKLPGDAATFLTKHPWHSMLAGCAFFFGLPLAAVLLAFTVFGLPLAAVIVMKFLTGLLVARVLAALVLVRWAEQTYRKSWNRWFTVLLTLVCFVALKILGVLPVVGTLASAALVLLGFGALLTVSWRKVRKVL